MTEDGSTLGRLVVRVDNFIKNGESLFESFSILLCRRFVTTDFEKIEDLTHKRKEPLS